MLMCVLLGNFTEFPTVLLVPFSALLQLIISFHCRLGVTGALNCIAQIQCHLKKKWMQGCGVWPYSSSIFGYGVTLFWEALFCKTWKSFAWKQVFKMTRHIGLLFHSPVRLFILKYFKRVDFCDSTTAFSKRTQLFGLARCRNSSLI